MRQIDKVLISVGRSFRANGWQMATEIYLPAMPSGRQRHPARPRRRHHRTLLLAIAANSLIGRLGGLGDGAASKNAHARDGRGHAGLFGRGVVRSGS
jgi:hypothetical protein